MSEQRDIRLICCDIADLTPLPNYTDSIENAMSDCDPVEIAKIVISQNKAMEAADKEIAQLKEQGTVIPSGMMMMEMRTFENMEKQIATKDAELARLREESRSWRSVAERLEREKQLSLHAWVSSDSEDSE